MVNDQIEADIDKVHLFDLVVEFAPLQDLQSVTINVEDSVRLDLSVTRLDD